VSVLRVYDPHECDEHGVPVDWERCRCRGSGRMGALATSDLLAIGAKAGEWSPDDPCPFCDGHGSLRAAALASTRERQLSEATMALYGGQQSYEGLTQHELTEQMQRLNRARAEADAAFVYRCEDCKHPMSEGTWAPNAYDYTHPDKKPVLAEALPILRAGDEPPNRLSVHYSPCDERCTHGLPLRQRTVGGAVRSMDYWDDVGAGERVKLGYMVEAAWRQVDVRLLGWPHDLSPWKLKVQCLRCYAASTSEGSGA
jgi:hypothetical protein